MTALDRPRTDELLWEALRCCERGEQLAAGDAFAALAAELHQGGRLPAVAASPARALRWNAGHLHRYLSKDFDWGALELAELVEGEAALALQRQWGGVLVGLLTLPVEGGSER